MWKPTVNFITLHYVYILFCSLLGLLVFAPYGNVPAVDAYFFGASGSTESGLNTVDVKDLKIYQQLFIYFVPMFTNLGFINIIVVAVRLYWFEERLRSKGPALLSRSWTWFTKKASKTDVEHDIEAHREQVTQVQRIVSLPRTPTTQTPSEAHQSRQDLPAAQKSLNVEKQWVDSSMPLPGVGHAIDACSREEEDTQQPTAPQRQGPAQHISFVPSVKSPLDPPAVEKVLYVPSPKDRDEGVPIMEKDLVEDDDDDPRDKIYPEPMDITGASIAGPSGLLRRRPYQFDAPIMSTAKSVERVASNLFVLGRLQPMDDRTASANPRLAELPYLSHQVTIGRNSQFHNLTREDKVRLGGIEYRSLKLLLKIVISYFFGLHLFGVIFLVPWIHNAPPKYTDYLAECGQDKTWWAFYSAQTMVDNLGFTLTPDSMAQFKDATWPILAMTFLAFAGNTLYPVFLRLLIWIASKIVPGKSTLSEPLQFLLDHPRRCYTLLFPSQTTWILFGIIFALNFVDVLLIIVLDLDNPAVNDLPMGPRILSAIFQAASSRHTGTSTLNLADVNPAVQFSLLVMMYIAILPIAISIRASNTYEETALGRYEEDHDLDESQGRSYVVSHVRNQLSFDLWYIFLGTFLICIAEADRIADNDQPAFSVFSVFFEVVSGYGNVGLSLGHPDVLTSLSGQFTTFSKVVVCAMMIRGRHRGLPYALDRAIMLPSERRSESGRDNDAVAE